MDILLQVAVILVCLFYGARKGGVALGLLGGIGIVIMTFVFGLPPGKPPVDVMLTIIAVVAASASVFTGKLKVKKRASLCAYNNSIAQTKPPMVKEILLIINSLET